MKKPFLPLALLAIGVSFCLAAKMAQALPKMIGEPGHRVRMLTAGNRGPVVVLDTFGAMASDMWGSIQWRCSEFSRVVSYDHLGTGGSDAGSKPRDARHIATELHTALHAAKLEPPYVLVGYSFGGPYSRVFADLFPNEVSGMVLIDPSPEEMFDWLKVHRPELNRASAKDEAEQNEFACTYISLNQARAGKVPNVPLTLITAMRPYGEMDHRLRPQWLGAHNRWLEQIPGAQQIVTDRSDHGIIWEEPDLVVETICKVVNQARR